VIIGAGAIGMEFADFYRSFGTDITVVEMLPTVLPVEDEEIIKEMSRSLRRKKIKTHVETRVTNISITDDSVSIQASGPKGEINLSADAVLMAIGVRPNTADLGLESLDIELSGPFIQVNERLETNIPGIYAIGDVAGPPLLAHKASMEALCCVNNLAGHASFQPINYDTIPGCTYCQPQVASVGLTEKAAVKKGYQVIKGVFPFRANGRSIAMEESDGIVKLVFDKSNHQLLGAHILHAGASELIAELGVALKMNATAHDLAGTIHAHPTLSEAVMEAAAVVLGEAVHI